MDGTRKYLECGNPITKEHTWYILTDMCVLSQELIIPKIQSTDYMKLKKEDQSWSSVLEGEQNTHWKKYRDKV